MSTFFGVAAAATFGFILARVFNSGGAAAGGASSTRAAGVGPPSLSLKHVQVGEGKYKMVLIVNMRLKMGKGKIAAQCGHATLAAYRRQFKLNPIAIKTWHVKGGNADVFDGGCPVTCGMAESLGLNSVIIQDAGRTQIEAGSCTVLAIGPALIDDVNKVTGHLKLL